MKNDKPLISVIVTSHNRPRTLHQTVSSILEQSYSNLQVIICDDLSTDPEVLSVINTFIKNDSRVELIIPDHKSGPAGNFNNARKVAKGEFISYFNDDDWIDRDYIEKCFDFLVEHHDYNLVVGTTKFYKNSKCVGICPAKSIEEEDSLSRFYSFHDKFLGTANCPNFGVFRKDEIKDIYMFCNLGDDNNFISNVVYRGKLKTLESTFLHRRLGGISESLSKTATILNYPSFEKLMPFPALYFNIIKDILFVSPNFSKMNVFKRLSVVFSFNILLVKNITKYLSRYKKRFVRQEEESSLPSYDLELKEVQLS